MTITESLKKVNDIFLQKPTSAVTLNLITSSKSGDDVQYTVFKGSLDVDVGQKMYDIGLNSLKKYQSQISSHTIRLEPYTSDELEDGIGDQDKNIMYISSKTDADGVHLIPHFDEIFPEIGNSDLDEFDLTSKNKLWAYVIRISIDNAFIYLLNKATASTIIGDKEKILFKPLHHEKYSDLDTKALSLSTIVDCIYYEPDNEDKILFILDKSGFESIFRYVDYYRNDIAQKIPKLSSKALILNEDKLLSLCEHDIRKIKRLKRILDKGKYLNFTDAHVPSLIDEYNLDITLEQGKMVVTSRNVYQILCVLEDYCAKSYVNDDKLLVGAAKTVQRT